MQSGLLTSSGKSPVFVKVQELAKERALRAEAQEDAARARSELQWSKGMAAEAFAQVGLVRHENIPAIHASDWSVMRIYL
eukprot:435596-Pyramimonas_sp.AAC.1